MKKVLCLVVFVLIMMVTMVSCNVSTLVEHVKTQNTSMFLEVERSVHWRIVYDRETKVMYAVSLGDSYGHFTPLLNADGTPKLYRGEE